MGGAVSPLKNIVASLSKASPEVQKIASESFSYAYEKFPTAPKAPGGADMQNVVPYLHGDLASALVSLPDGYNILYSISKQIMPQEALAYKHLYFNGDSKTFGPEITKVLPDIIMEDVIPEYIGENVGDILNESRWMAVQERPSRDQFATGSIDGLVTLYNEINITDYDWHGFGLEREKIKWDYHSYDLPQVSRTQKSGH